MSPEYILFVALRAKSDGDKEQIRQAILMVKGVQQASWNEVPVVPATEDQILEMYLEDLTSRDTPPFVEGCWIRSHLLDLSRYQLRDWVKSGYISASLEYPGRGRRKFTIEEAEIIGRVWYLYQKGISPKTAALTVKGELKAI